MCYQRNTRTLRGTYYDTKKIMKGLRVEYEKTDLCKNDCVLFYEGQG